jgi:hypothetical protein
MTTVAESHVFRQSVLEHFEFLVTELGFVGPELHRYGACYYSPDVSIEIIPYDAAGHYVETFATAMVGERRLRAELSCLYIRAGQGGRNRAGTQSFTVRPNRRGCRRRR